MTKKPQRPNPPADRRISAADSPRRTTNDQQPFFSFRYHDHGKDFCVANCSNEEKAAVIDWLYTFSQRTWQDMANAPRTGAGYEKLPRAQIKAAVPKNVTEEVDFIVFRTGNGGHVVGFRVDLLFHIVWIDFKFKLYDHG
ncbi:MAG: hypothetical protein SGJ24_00420 [Chloroflexota bacterium]|nr:hypothetical protein [Chloroflexota bacterium]